MKRQINKSERQLRLRKKIENRMADNPWLKIELDLRAKEREHRKRMPPLQWYKDRTWKSARISCLDNIKDHPDLSGMSDGDILNLLDHLPPGWKIDASKRISSETLVEYLKKTQEMINWEPDPGDGFFDD